MSARAVLVWNIVQDVQGFNPRPGLPIEVTISGLRNPYTNVPTDSFSVQTFDTFSENGKLNFYFIDKKATGMVIVSKCNYPCKDCLDGDGDSCTACYADSLTPFLQLSTCVEQCATSRFFNRATNRCDLCDSTCLQCSGRADICTKCGVGDHLYLDQDQNRCLIECEAGWLEDSSKNLCIPCNENCRTCEKKVTSCTSCDKSSAWPYFFHDTCISKCEPNISVLLDGACVECHSSCKTCSGLPTYCTSCEPFMKFDPTKGTCSDMCEYETQIFVPNVSDPNEAGKCEFCNPTCQKCAGTVDNCTVCKEGFVLNTD